jgi:pyruvate,water dikinase
MTDLAFAPPGPGAWELDASHLSRPATRFLAEVYPEPMARGFAEGAARYGLLLERLEMRFVNGFPYTAARPVGAPPHAVGPPPKLVFQLLTRLHPAIRKRVRTSREVFERRAWREDLVAWDQTLKPAAIRCNLELTAVDPRRLDDDALLAHLGDCREQLAAMLYQHHRLSVPSLLPVGDFVAQAQAWTGQPAERLLGLLRGSSPASAGLIPEFEALIDALRRKPEAAWALGAEDPAAALAALQARQDEVGAAARTYLAIVGYRSTHGYDVGDPYPLELPDTLVRSLREALAKRPVLPGPPDASAMRDAVPEGQRAAFDALLAEAREMNRLRDERTLYCDLWATGLTRRALLAVGERAGLERADHAVEAGFDEIKALMAGAGPSAGELAERARRRHALCAEDAPATLGPLSPGPPPAAWLPTAASRRAQAATHVIVNGIFKPPPARKEGQVVHGLGVFQGVYEGTARLITGPEQFDRLRPGDVLVTRTTAPSFNVVLPLLGALVTDYGGMLAHAAIVAREYGIPGVVGTREGTRTIPDGARVRVDGDRGLVEVLYS